MPIRKLVETDPDVCAAIVFSLRLYIEACECAGRLPNITHLVERAFAEDKGTKALIQANKIGADDA